MSVDTESSGHVAPHARCDVAHSRTGVGPWYAVGLLMLISVLGYLDRLVLGFLVDPIKLDLALSDTEVGVLTGFAFAAFYVLMGLPLGRWIDLGSRRVVLTLCVTGWSAMTVACGAAWNFATLFIARMGVAAGEAGLNPAAVSMISDLFDRDRAALPISLYTLGIYIGGGMAIMLGGALIDYFASLGGVDVFGFVDVAAWRLVFIAVGVPGVIVALVFFFTVREPVRSEAIDAGTDGPGLSTVLAFLNDQRLLYLTFFGAMFVFGFYLYAVLGWYPVMLMRTYGITAADAGIGYGLTYLIFGVAGALSVGPMIAALARRGVDDGAVVVCLISMAVAVVPSVAGPLMPTAWLCIACFAVTKYCWAATITIAFVGIAEVTPNAMRGLTTSLYMAVMNITGGAFGAVIVGVLSDHVFGEDQIRYAMSLVAAVFLPVAALGFALARKPYRRRLAALQSPAGDNYVTRSGVSA